MPASKTPDGEGEGAGAGEGQRVRVRVRECRSMGVQERESVRVLWRKARPVVSFPELNMHVCMRVCTRVCMRICMHACMHVCACICAHACVYAPVVGFPELDGGGERGGALLVDGIIWLPYGQEVAL